VESLAPDRIRPISRAEYDRMVDDGYFVDERIELLRGVLVSMSPQGSDHANAVRQLDARLTVALDGRATISPQCPFAALDDSEPEPDLAVLERRSHFDGHPTRAHLVIEVACSSLPKDQGIKAEIYAESGVPEYWIVDLAAERIEVRRSPRDGEYRTVTRYGRGTAIALLAFPDVTIAVDDVLPPAP